MKGENTKNLIEKLVDQAIEVGYARYSEEAGSALSIQKTADAEVALARTQRLLIRSLEIKNESQGVSLAASG